MYHGQGELVDQVEQLKLRGMFEYDEPHGESMLYDSHGVWVVNFNRGKKHGRCTFKSKLYEFDGLYQDGQKQGKGLEKILYSNGSFCVFQGTWKKDRKQRGDWTDVSGHVIQNIEYDKAERVSNAETLVLNPKLLLAIESGRCTVDLGVVAQYAYCVNAKWFCASCIKNQKQGATAREFRLQFVCQCDEGCPSCFVTSK